MNKKYLVWNNKGGVGKTFLSYNLGVEYALQHPEEDVIVVDACPQTNVSEMILGGNGKGFAAVNRFADSNKTIAGYIKRRFSESPHEKLGTEPGYFIQANTVNSKMPENLYLLVGDMDLDICSKLINHLGTAPVRGAWEHSRTLLNDLVTSFEKTRSDGGRKQTFFIDCNPSFSNYTENAVLASNLILIPCTADAASIRGIKNLFNLIYNVSLEQQKLSDEFVDFYQDVQKTALQLPKIHLFIQNRSRSQNRDATRAFQSHADEIERLVQSVYSEQKSLFSDGLNTPRVLNVKDGNTVAAIINHEGCPLSSLQPRRYSIYGQETQANNEQIQALKADIQTVLDAI